MKIDVRNTIKTQLYFIALTPLFLIIAFASVFILFESIDSVEDELNKRGKDITSQASLMSEFYFYPHWSSLLILQQISKDLAMRLSPFHLDKNTW